ncbi:MAG: fibronectin type III domain-containing protein [bacterium]
MTRKLTIGFLALIVSALNILNIASVDSAKASSVYTELYATKGVDTTSIFPHYLNSGELNSLKHYDGDRYQIKGKWNKYITDWDKLELKNFETEDPANAIPSYATIEEVFLHGMWKKDEKEMQKAWVTIFNGVNQYETQVYAPLEGIDNPISINLTSFLNTPQKLANAKVRFQVKSAHALPISERVTTWHNEFQLRIQYNNQELEGGIVYDAPDSTYAPYVDHDWSANSDKIAASWGGFSGADIIKYEVGLGTTQGSTDICSFTNVNLDTQIEFTGVDPNCSGFPLINEQKYFFTVKAYTNQPCYFHIVSSDGITIDTEGPTVSIFPPSDGQHLNKTFAITADVDDGLGIGVEKVEFQLNDMSLTKFLNSSGALQNTQTFFTIDTNGGDGYSTILNTLNPLGNPVKIPDGDYNIKVQATDFLGNINDTDITIHIDNTPPANPNLNVEATSTQAHVYWNSDPDAKSYNLFRDGKLIAGNVTFTSYIDKDVVPGETYNYRVTAKDHLGNENTGSDINATIPEPGSIISSASSRLAAILGEADTPLPEDENEDQGEILGTTVDKTDSENKDDSEKGNYSGWIYLLLLYILIILGYYYYYLRDDYTPWFWVFPLIVGLILLFINNSLVKVLEASNMAKLFWLWELIIFIIFVVYYQFFGRPVDENEILKKYKVKPRKK